MKAPEFLRRNLMDTLRRELLHPTLLVNLREAGADLGGTISPRDQSISIAGVNLALSVTSSSVFAKRKRKMSKRRWADILACIGAMCFCTDLRSQFIAVPFQDEDGSRAYANRSWQEMFEIAFGEAVPGRAGTIRIKRFGRIMRQLGYLRTSRAYRSDPDEQGNKYTKDQYRARPAYKQLTDKFWAAVQLLDVLKAAREQMAASFAQIEEKKRRKAAKRQRLLTEKPSPTSLPKPQPQQEMAEPLHAGERDARPSPIDRKTTPQAQAPPPHPPPPLPKLPGETAYEYHKRCMAAVLGEHVLKK